MIEHKTGKEIKITGVSTPKVIEDLAHLKAIKAALKRESDSGRSFGHYWNMMYHLVFFASDMECIPLGEGALTGNLEKIAESAIKSGYVELIARDFFGMFPEGTYISDAVLKHKHDSVAFESVLLAALRTAFTTGCVYHPDSTATKSVADVAQNYAGNGLQLKRVMDTLEAVAHNAPDAIENLAKVIPHNDWEKTKIIISTVGSVVRYTQDSAAVNAIVDVVRNYQGAGFKQTMELLAQKAYITRDGSLVKAAAERYVAESKGSK